MDRKFEKWVTTEENKLSENIVDCFKESIDCYRAECYRSAIIMAISGFNLLLRDRILYEKTNISKEADNSTDLNIKKIAGYLNDNDLVDDNEWDRFLVNTLLTKENFSFIFSLKKNNKIFTDWQYWRNRRNISAHAQNYKIIFADVESCYSWIMQTSKLLYPLTNINSILKYIEDFFDYSNTPISSDLHPLFEKIEIENNKENIKKISDKLFSIFFSSEIHKSDNRIYDITNFMLLKSNNKELYRNIFIDIFVTSNFNEYKLIKIFYNNTDIIKYYDYSNKYNLIMYLLKYLGNYISNSEISIEGKYFDNEIVNKLTNYIINILEYKEYQNIIENIIRTNQYDKNLYFIIINIIKIKDSTINYLPDIYFENDIDILLDGYFVNEKMYLLNTILKYKKINENVVHEKIKKRMYCKYNFMYEDISAIKQYEYIYKIIYSEMDNIIFKHLDGYKDYNIIGNLLSWVDFSNLNQHQLSNIINIYKIHTNSLYKYNSIFHFFKLEYLEKYKNEYKELEKEIDYMIDEYNIKNNN